MHTVAINNGHYYTDVARARCLLLAFYGIAFALSRQLLIRVSTVAVGAFGAFAELCVIADMAVGVATDTRVMSGFLSRRRPIQGTWTDRRTKQMLRLLYFSIEFQVWVQKDLQIVRAPTHVPDCSNL